MKGHYNEHLALSQSWDIFIIYINGGSIGYIHLTGFLLKKITNEVSEGDGFQRLQVNIVIYICYKTGYVEFGGEGFTCAPQWTTSNNNIT